MDPYPEKWLPIAEFPSYEVSTLGRVRRIGRQDARARGRHKQGYWLVTFPGPDGRQVGRYVHRLVALAFIPNPLGLPVVRHEDDDESNSRVDNLVWSTQQANILQAMDRRGNWLLAAPKRLAPVLRIDPDTAAETHFPSIRAAVDDINRLTVANGGIAKPYPAMASNIVHARDLRKIAYGFYWLSPRKRLVKATLLANIELDLP